tara:strand:+ start:189 stop:761 length:573 start_codon:yes stop_codon:yes gene_type:complete
MADGTLKVGQITTSSGSGTITLGQSGETVDMANGSITLNSDMKATPAFQAFLSANQTLADNTQVKIQANTESFDTDSAYDNSTNYRFTPQTSGKYVFYANVRTSAGDSNNSSTSGSIYKNGSIAAQLQQFTPINGLAANVSAGNLIILEANGSSDYFEFFGLCNDTSGDGVAIGSSYPITYFGAYKVIGA